MPPRVAIQPRPIRAPSHRFPRAAAFHTSRVCAAGVADTTSKNHYERLNIRHDASPAEIKKSFYSLSKAHHPDVNPSDPHAAHTFSLLSESYTILSDPSRRATYDRDVLRLHHHHHHHHHHHQQHHRPGTSYHSSHPSAGGRSPSGLSRRRAAFRGPPPSFYKNGAWGSQEERRKRATAAHAAHAARANGFTSAQDAGSSHAQRAQQGRPDPWDLGGGVGGGMGFGSGPFAYASEPPPHFDREAHERTQRREDERRQRRARRANRVVGDEGEEFEPQVSLGGHFLIVAGILAVTFMGPFVYLQRRISARREGRMD
ncbi:hypothetical protein E4U61_001016 [Claviceps capensis]|nr:hypothetical protein E4U61_001016 [Claviceps capensis]